MDLHRTDIIQRVCQVKPILDKILANRVITDEGYSTVMAKRTTQDQMRALYMGPLKASGIRAKNIFYEILKELEPLLIKDLKGEWGDGMVNGGHFKFVLGETGINYGSYALFYYFVFTRKHNIRGV